jgi:hypothetical protein
VYLLFAGPLFFKEVTLMKQEQQVHIQKSKDALSYYRQMQRLYAASCGGYLGIRECDDTYNDWNRKIIDAYRERYGAAYLGRINYSGNQRQRIADGTESVFEAYTGQPLYNFCCDFCVSAPDRTLEELIRHWNNAAVPLSEKKVDAIMDRIQVLCGQTFIWY